MTASASTVLAVVLLAVAGAAAVDLRRQQETTLVVYTTAALKPVLERDLVPRFQNETGQRVELVYVAAGEQYNRLRMSGRHPEADVFLHASPLYIEKGYGEGYFQAFDAPAVGDARFERADSGGLVWRAFAWSPVVEVYAPRLGAAPDLATHDLRFGFPDPLLSNNGVYAVAYFEALSPEAGLRALDRTTIQPTNAAANMGGITDGSFDVTLGYEAVALLYHGKGAHLAFDLPLLDGERRLLPATMSVGLVRDHPHAAATEFVRFLFTDETQSLLARSHLRAVTGEHPPPEGALDVEGVEPVGVDWSQWARIEEKLMDYQVRR